MKKSSPETADYLADLLSDYNCQIKKMFGSPVHFVNGNMMAGVFGDNIFLRLSPDDKADLLEQYDEAVPFDPMGGWPMREYAELPESLTHSPEINLWLAKSFEFVSSLPVKKKPKPKKKKKI